VNACENSMRQSRRTMIVGHRSACFEQKNMITKDVHPSGVLTEVMESVTPL